MATSDRNTRRNGKMAVPRQEGSAIDFGDRRIVVDDLQAQSGVTGVQPDIEDWTCPSCGSHYLDPGASGYPAQCDGPKNPRCAFLHWGNAVRSEPDEQVSEESSGRA